VIIRRSALIYGFLAAAWCLLAGWQVAEHLWVRRSARATLIDRARAISSTVGIVVRSQRHFGGVINKERLEQALNRLVEQGEMSGVALLNAGGNVVAAAGTPVDPQMTTMLRAEPIWGDQSVAVMNLVDFGTNVVGSMDNTNPPIVLSRQDMPRPPFDTNRPPPGPPPGPPQNANPDSSNAPPRDAFGPPTPGPEGSTNRPRPRAEGGRPRFPRPFWMSEEEFNAMTKSRGVHSFVIIMSTQALHRLSREDLWLRSVIGVLATVSVVGSGMAWRNLARSSELEIRLVRASESNTHLKEMNLAAAGLAHETRNPLNIIRGLAQMISKEEKAPSEIRKKSREIVDEADRVTAQLNEFINYSKPRQVRPVPVALGRAIGDVVRALSSDVEDKNLRLQVLDAQLTIEADEQLLRQALFNLLINAIQAVDQQGEITVAAQRRNHTGVVLEVRDNGPGVPPERRTEVFKPYFTTNAQGTGLGLAVVQQIVLAHGWEIECLPNQPQGAIFRISHMKLAGST
jgi:signal transduction histidine kinase